MHTCACFFFTIQQIINPISHHLHHGRTFIRYAARKPARLVLQDEGGISYKFAVISNEALLGVFDTFDEALEHALNEKKAGEFLIQQCLKDFKPVQYYNKAVFF